MKEEYELRILTFRDGEHVGTDYCMIDNEELKAIIHIVIHGVKEVGE